MSIDWDEASVADGEAVVMATSALTAPPVLATQDDSRLLPAEGAAFAGTEANAAASILTEDDILIKYEVERTALELCNIGSMRIALQFPDGMLADAPRVAELLQRALRRVATSRSDERCVGRHLAPQIHILADTSYSACCIDELAASHVDADVVVHYGRACLSPTNRLPVIYVYTTRTLDYETSLCSFSNAFPDKSAAVVIMADLTYQSHVQRFTEQLRMMGYDRILATDVVRDPMATIPNRRIEGNEKPQVLREAYSLFHISDPPSSLLLVLQSRFASIRVLPTPSTDSSAQQILSQPVDDSTTRATGLLRRRYARVLSLASSGVIGILVNTLSVADYLSSIDFLRAQVAQAGKKSYTVVVGKLNPAKLANFADIEGWVAIGCWESGLVEDDVGYWRPIVTPYELQMALASEHQRVWGGEWWGGIEMLARQESDAPVTSDDDAGDDGNEALCVSIAGNDLESSNTGYGDSSENITESFPPEFDLRSGKLTSSSRPMQLAVRSSTDVKSGTDIKNEGKNPVTALASRPKGDMARIRGEASPGADFLRSKRTWQGLGSDFVDDPSTLMQEGQKGIARAYQPLSPGKLMR